ncbi:hypothetical protein BRCON_1915 [Candidatus Sumerlaea chitinivorans]|uniref:Uncharacterized protein n=1 Tax=Sumerlaea chitinivorans TaxID=2250252 RepID=A0A2Z4Y7R9_SUMC1|nr:hypothetical protein BRCON_1915 [Candidatus Sumerlaea chitinivorans]
MKNRRFSQELDPSPKSGTAAVRGEVVCGIEHERDTAWRHLPK